MRQEESKDDFTQPRSSASQAAKMGVTDRDPGHSGVEAEADRNRRVIQRYHDAYMGRDVLATSEGTCINQQPFGFHAALAPVIGGDLDHHAAHADEGVQDTRTFEGKYFEPQYTGHNNWRKGYPFGKGMCTFCGDKKHRAADCNRRFSATMAKPMDLKRSKVAGSYGNEPCPFKRP